MAPRTCSCSSSSRTHKHTSQAHTNTSKPSSSSASDSPTARLRLSFHLAKSCVRAYVRACGTRAGVRHIWARTGRLQAYTGPQKHESPVFLSAGFVRKIAQLQPKFEGKWSRQLSASFGASYEQKVGQGKAGGSEKSPHRRCFAPIYWPFNA